jgi:hypothetical protein
MDSEELKKNEEYRLGRYHEFSSIYDQIDKYVDHHKKLRESYPVNGDENQLSYLAGKISAGIRILELINTDYN